MLVIIGSDRPSEIVGEYGTRPLYRMLGYFSVIGLLRVHSLLGDFTLALKVMENVELNQKVCSTLILRQTSAYGLLVFLHPCHRLSCHHLLLRRLLLHYATQIS